MHKISTFLLSILLISLTGCEDKKPKSTPLPIEDTTEIFTQKDLKQQENKRFLLEQKQEILLADPSQEVYTPPKLIDKKQNNNTFMLLNTKSKSHKVTLSDDHIIFHHNSKPIVLVNIFATWCPPCIGALAYLNTLEKKYNDDLFLLGVLTNDYIDIPLLESFIATHEINYFISNSPHNNAFSGLLARTLDLPQNFSIPLTVMYVDGKYFTHYEGSVPVEMIEYDIQQAQKQLKSKSNED